MLEALEGFISRKILRSSGDNEHVAMEFPNSIATYNMGYANPFMLVRKERNSG